MAYAQEPLRSQALICLTPRMVGLDSVDDDELTPFRCCRQGGELRGPDCQLRQIDRKRSMQVRPFAYGIASRCMQGRRSRDPRCASRQGQRQGQVRERWQGWKGAQRLLMPAQGRCSSGVEASTKGCGNRAKGSYSVTKVDTQDRGAAC
jgi:hypothetical protein